MDLEKNFARFQFLDHRISELIVKNTIQNYDEDSVSGRTLDADFKVLHVGELEGQHTGLIQLYVNISLEMRDDTALAIRVLMEGAFACPIADINIEGFTRMLELNGTSALYSIARGLILSISAQTMNGVNVRIPLMNVVAWHNSKYANQVEQKEEPAGD